jgi:hypothetical protein
MKVVSSPHFDFRLGWLRHLHPFDGLKFGAVHAVLAGNLGVKVHRA